MDTLSEKNEAIQREMVWVLKMGMRWFVYDVVRGICFPEEA